MVTTEKINDKLEELYSQGFSLEEKGDHILELYYYGKFIARFNQSVATKPLLQAICQEYLDTGKVNH